MRYYKGLKRKIIADKAIEIGKNAAGLPPDTPHHVVAGEEGLRFLCFCTPGYRHDNTVLLEGDREKEVLK
jgi:hypothetical protein